MDNIPEEVKREGKEADRAIRELAGAKSAPDWQQKYLELEEKYRVEIPQLNIELAELAHQTRSAKAELENLRKGPDQETASLDLQGHEKAKVFKDEYPDVYEGTVETARIVAKELLEQSRKPEPQPIPSGREYFYAYLTDRVPDWQQLNRDPNFISYLENTPDLSGGSKFARMNELYSQKDLDGVARYFEEWKGLRSQPQVEPISNKEIEKFYDERARGLWQGREKEADEMEAKIIATSAAGLVTP